MPRRTPVRRALLTLLAALALALATLTVVQSASTSASAAVDPFTVRPGTTQLEVLDGTPGEKLELLRDGAVVHTGAVDAQGSLVWRKLRAGVYTVRTTAGAPAFESTPRKVTGFRAPPPPQSFYSSQHIDAGFDFIETRDHTTLSANVVLPNPQLFGPGPYPTVVEYSGYDPSNPRNTSFSTLMNGLGYAYVGVNIRGTGCSGGSFLPFEPVQSLDGYDAIEAIAAQPWVKFNKVGMVGISYPGISQLYAARYQPPHLSAISPLSVLDDSYRATLWPGGMLNTGFAVSWANQRFADSQPYGEGWEHDPDPAHPGANATCDANQRVRLQNPDPVALIRDNQFYNKAYYQQIDPSRFVHKINVPVYLGGAWQDEQTGGHFPDFLHRFTSSPAVYATMSNGGHVESLADLTSFSRYADFLSLYVAHTVPVPFFRDVAGPRLAGAITGIDGLTAQPGTTYTGLTYKQALRKYSKGGHVRIMFESGDAKGEPKGAPAARFVRTFRSWPIPSRKVTRFYLQPGGGLSGKPVATSAAATQARSFRADPKALPTTDFDPASGNIWGAHPTYHWKQIPKGKGLGWVTSPLTSTTVAIGNGSLDVWVKTAAKDVDLEATITDVRPNGKEVYVQSGWLRASHRALIASRSTATRPVHVDTARSVKPMPKNRYRLLRLELFPFAQPFRAGDRIRITLDAPGNARPSWAFDTLDHGQKVTVATDARHRSLLALSVVPGVSVPARAPACGDLRSQPCRTFRG